MEITITLTDEQKKRLKSIFNFVENYNETEVLENIMKAAKEEYIVQFLDDGNKNSVGEIRQFRLFLLVKHVFKGKIPSEIEVASIFKIPQTSAKTLIKNMKSRYQFEMESYFKGTIKDILDVISEDDLEDEEYYKFNIRSAYMYSEMNQIIELKDQNCEKIKRYNSVSSYYKISKKSKELLEKYINE
ncbi:hypothetical protein L3049_08310 [Labilibaculum sp. DW002]|uniref:Uncharacterized protein n=1 Tax=Paralabilibaculum antarcticum TaxID=2912572 RepID=A0ABT5VRF1_9BACT|nr:hypothetical protein [Labilibaculum sp. DW002]MDE5418009.1 hypothetical protein [Labilibaculum sp. DW002]